MFLTSCEYSIGIPPNLITFITLLIIAHARADINKIRGNCKGKFYVKGAYSCEYALQKA